LDDYYTYTTVLLQQQTSFQNRMNDEVYPVTGGMEDWAYAASWDPNHTIPCTPLTYDGYDASRTTYDAYVLRALNMLIETSDDKIPRSHLGTSQQLLARPTAGANGHVTRNVRLALAALEMVQPYVYVDTVENVRLSNDDWQCRHVRVAATAADDSSTVRLHWTVGGSVHVDDVQVYHKKWTKQLSEQYCNKGGAAVMMTALPPGGDDDDDGNFWRNGTDVSSSTGGIDLSTYSVNDEIAVIVRVRVDQAWRGQSHVVNARTNPNYRAEHNGYVVQGRLDWYSVPILLHKAGPGEEAKELYVRYDSNYQEGPKTYPDADNSGGSTPTAPTLPDQPSSSSITVGWLVVIAIVFVATALVVQRIVRSMMRQSRRDRVRDFIYDKAAIPPGLNGYEDIPHRDAGEVDLSPMA
jgi:hypothetical protein